MLRLRVRAALVLLRRLLRPDGGRRTVSARERIYADIDAERARQAAKWDRDHDWGHGDCSSAGVAGIVKAAVLAEECGEVARAVLDRKPDDLRAELVQVAAVCVGWLEALDLAEAVS